MDNQNTKMKSKYFFLLVVLILVLMDNQNTTNPEKVAKALKSLNPCSNG